MRWGAVQVVACVLGAAVLAGGCATHPPLQVTEMREPQLRRIHEAMEQTIEFAENDPDTTWLSGWTGNMAVNAFDESFRGLCYHWRDLVWDGVHEAVREQGWEAVGLTINRDTMFEHHAVLVWDPKIVPKDLLLRQRPPSHGYVLDGWAHGEADVYRLDEWIDNQMAHERAPEIKELPAPRRLPRVPAKASAR